jgi:glycosyltransferase involved in cell wall biosynthesis
MRILVLTTLYPNSIKPSHGVFVENRLRAIARTHKGCEIRVIAPVPWFPFSDKLFGAYGDYAKVPVREWRYGLEIRHPRFFVPPKLAMNFAPRALEKCFSRAIDDVLAEGWDFDLIDAHYFYPDGVAAMAVGERFNKPVVITARGTDINLLPKFPRPRKMITEAAEKASASITVCDALRDEMINLGIEGDKIHRLRNGVDLEQFRPLDRDRLRKELNLTGPVIASVGHLIKRKGHDLVLRALASLPDTTLLIAGDGPERRNLENLAHTLKIENRVRFLGRIHPRQMPEIYNMADVLALGSDREGWPNVLLEAMACGTPCVAFDIWGCAEVIGHDNAGLIVKHRSADTLSEALKQLLANLPPRIATRHWAENFSWDDTTKGVVKLWQNALNTMGTNAVPARPVWAPVAALPESKTPPPVMVTVDTEEIFDWDCPKPVGHSLSLLGDFARFQILCERLEIIPHYFLTWPLMEDTKTAAWFKQIFKSGKATLGLHLHAWETPPDHPMKREGQIYQSSMPQELHLQTLQHLAKLFETVFGFRATTHRAGRYGISPGVMEDLAETGIVHDFSPSAGFDFRSQGGPDFTRLGAHPFYHRTRMGDIITCLPPSGARAIKRTQVFLPQNLNTIANFKSATGWRETLQTNLTAPMRLTPEGNSSGAMIALARALARSHVPLLTLSFHSSTLTPGATPYTKDKQDVKDFLARLEQFLHWQKQHGGGFFNIRDLDKQRWKTLANLQ